MGLKCSVLGHKYGDVTVERDREEQGSEVVITIEEIETCSRCGNEQVVSENKEVTTLATPDEPADTEPTGDADEEASIDAAEGNGDDAVDQPVQGVDEASGAEEPAVDDAPPADATEGAEILEAETDDSVADDELADPSIEGPPLGSDPVEETPVEEDAVIIDEDEAEADTDGRQPGEWPDEPDDGTDEDWTPSDALDEETPITAPDAGTENNSAVTIPDGQFRCPECGYTTLVEDSSLRAGDFCPECRKGSLVHEPRDETRKE